MSVIWCMECLSPGCIGCGDDERASLEVRIRADEREALIAIIERDVSNTHVAAHLIAAIRARGGGK